MQQLWWRLKKQRSDDREMTQRLHSPVCHFGKWRLIDTIDTSFISVVWKLEPPFFAPFSYRLNTEIQFNMLISEQGLLAKSYFFPLVESRNCFFFMYSFISASRPIFLWWTINNKQWTCARFRAEGVAGFAPHWYKKSNALLFYFFVF